MFHAGSPAHPERNTQTAPAASRSHVTKLRACAFRGGRRISRRRAHPAVAGIAGFLPTAEQNGRSESRSGVAALLARRYHPTAAGPHQDAAPAQACPIPRRSHGARRGPGSPAAPWPPGRSLRLPNAHAGSGSRFESALKPDRVRPGPAHWQSVRSPSLRSATSAARSLRPETRGSFSQPARIRPTRRAPPTRRPPRAQPARPGQSSLDGESSGSLSRARAAAASRAALASAIAELRRPTSRMLRCEKSCGESGSAAGVGNPSRLPLHQSTAGI